MSNKPGRGGLIAKRIAVVSFSYFAAAFAGILCLIIFSLIESIQYLGESVPHFEDFGFISFIYIATGMVASIVILPLAWVVIFIAEYLRISSIYIYVVVGILVGTLVRAIAGIDYFPGIEGLIPAGFFAGVTYWMFAFRLSASFKLLHNPQKETAKTFD